MRPIWKGAISFGMVTIPIKIYSATEDKDVRFHLLHRKDLAPIAQKRFCSEENVEVPWDEIVRGVESETGEWIAIDPDEVEGVEPETAHTIEIGDFVELGEIDPIYYEKTYYLEPGDIGAKPYALLRRALDDTGMIAVARVAIRTKERLATIRPYDGTLVLETMYWPDEIRSTSELTLPSGKSAEPSGREAQMARSLVENLSAHFDPGQYHDRYREALEELIERRMHGQKPVEKRALPSPKVTDLMAALEASVKAAQDSRKRGEPPRVAAGKTAAAVRTASKRQAQERVEEARKAPAKKERRRKSAA